MIQVFLTHSKQRSLSGCLTLPPGIGYLSIFSVLPCILTLSVNGTCMQCIGVVMYRCDILSVALIFLLLLLLVPHTALHPMESSLYWNVSAHTVTFILYVASYDFFLASIAVSAVWVVPSATL